LRGCSLLGRTLSRRLSATAGELASLLGRAIDQVRKLLKLADERKRPCAEVRGVAAAHLEDVQAKIADLRAMERVLRETVARCADGRRADCPLIEALYREAP
jgi:MerR family transcriptional regulator, mercuric resistance operon regulatory protein